MLTVGQSFLTNSFACCIRCAFYTRVGVYLIVVMVAAVPAGSCSQEAPVLLPGPLHDSSNTTINEYEKQQLQLGKAGKARQSQVRTVVPDLNALHCRNQPREQQRSHGGVEQEPRRRAARLPVAKENAKHPL